MRHVFKINFILTILLFSSSFAFSREKINGTLIVFVQPEKSAVARDFNENYFRKISELAGNHSLNFRLYDASKGAPAEITMTPMIAIQSERGLSFYQGRYSNLKRIKNFVRTSAYVSSGQEKWPMENMPVYQIGRLKVAAVFKIGQLAGAIPKDFNQEAYLKEAKKSIIAGFSHLKLKRKTELARGDRVYFMDFYPFLSENGKLHISLALFSQFHCEKPVFQTAKEKPMTGTFKNIELLFADAGKKMESKMLKVMSSTKSGDGVNAVNANIKVLKWTEMSLPEIEKKKNILAVDSKLTVPKNWVIAKQKKDDAPMLSFGFPPPIDYYRGEFLKVESNIFFSENAHKNSIGFIRCFPKNITMGEKDLDETLQSEFFFDTENFPQITFKIENIDLKQNKLSFGKIIPLDLEGKMTIKEKSAALTIRAQAELYLNNKGKIFMNLTGKTALNLKHFNIEKAYGPAPANHTVNVYLNLKLIPAKK